MKFNKACRIQGIADKIRCSLMRLRFPKTNNNQLLTVSGMTLMEIVVAMSILAMIMVLLWGTTTQGLNSKERVEKRDQVLNQARVAYHKILDDLSMAFLTKAPAEGETENKTMLTYFVADNKGEEDSIKFTSFSHLRYFANAKESDQSQIEYKLVPSNEEDAVGMNLVRTDVPWLDYDLNIDGRPYVLAKNVKSFDLEFYDEKNGEWGENWDTEKIDWKGRLPKAVRIRISFVNPEGENEEPMVFTSAIIIPLSNSVVEF